MQLLNFFALVGMTINDLISIYSVVGSVMLFIGGLSKSSKNKLSQFADWSILGLIFGCISQIAMGVTGTTPEKIGILIPMSPLVIDGLLFLSFLLLLSRQVIKKRRF